MRREFLLGKYWHPDHVMEALGRLKEKNISVFDVYAPFPLHGIEPYLNIKRTRLTIASFIYGLLGGSLAFLCMILIFGEFWPMNIGGKPSIAVPSFAPITFEMTVFFAAHGIFFTFLIVGQYWPGKKAKLMDDRQTDDVFVIAIDKNKISDFDTVSSIFEETGAFEITEKEE